jgi:hypothetical protein
MKTIPLTRSDVILIDDSDYEFALNYHWWALRITEGNKITYAAADVFTDGTRQTILLHRMLLRPSAHQYIDHINHNGLDDQRNNIRISTMSQNLANKRIQSNNKSGYKGVHWHKQRNKWAAEICVNYKRQSLGLWSDPWRAAQAYNTAALEAWGEFALLNIQLPERQV